MELRSNYGDLGEEICVGKLGIKTFGTGIEGVEAKMPKVTGHGWERKATVFMLLVNFISINHAAN